jgi:hypothetical protein
MSQRTARLQVPIDQAVLDQLQIMSNELGFDSVPSMIRFWAKAEINLRSQKTGLNRPNTIVLRYLELILALNPEPVNADRALEYLFRKLQQVKFRKFFKDLPQGPTSDKIHGT